MRHLICKLLIITAIFLEGCSQQIERPTLEDYAFIGVLGIDSAPKGQLKITATAPRPEGGQKQKTEIFQTTVTSIHEFIMKLTTESDRAISTNQLRVVLISETLARKTGIYTLIKNLYRDPAIGDTVLVSIVKGSVSDLLQTNFKGKSEINRYLNDLLRPRSDSVFSPFTTIHDLMYSLTDETGDPIVPYIEKDKDKIKISHVALFKNDKMIDLISPQEGTILSAMHHNTKLPNMRLSIHEKGEKKPTSIVLNFIRSKKEVKSNGSLSKPAVYVSLHVKSSILEYTGRKDLEKEEQVRLVEEAISKELERQMATLLKKLQKRQVDPLFLGEYIRSHVGKEKFKKEAWRKSFRKAKLTAHVHTLIISTGTLK